MTDVDRRTLLASIFGGRPWIVALDVLAGTTPIARALSELGAERALCIATSRGTGEPPDAEFAPDPIVIETDAALHYGRAASFWDPPDADREAMREVARRTGKHPRRSVGYRGAFTVDGILGEGGFVPTELNPRLGAGLFVLAPRLDLRLELFNAAVVEGEPVDWRPRELERHWLELADRYRSGGGMALTQVKQTETRTASLVWTGDGFRVANDGEMPDATALLGPSAMGGFLKVELSPERTPVGPPAAPRVASALACLDAHFGLGVGPLEPVREVETPR